MGRAAVPDIERTWLKRSGEMGKLIARTDWSQSPLGPIEGWPLSLKTTVSLCLASNFPISIAWGPHHIQIYNDGYWPICGLKHPTSMGQDFTKCWASAWPEIGSAFERALGGETSYLEDQRMFLDRAGYLEETFFTFSFSPIRDETGEVAGLFHPVSETTVRMVSERRTRALKDLAGAMAGAKTFDELFLAMNQTMAGYAFDLPFVLIYRIDGRFARLAQATGVPRDSSAAPEVVALDDPAADRWGIGASQRGGARQITDIGPILAECPCGPYPEPPVTAFAMPLVASRSGQVIAVVIAGASRRLPLTEAYRAFFDLLSATLTSAVGNVLAYDEQRRQAEALAALDRAKTAFFSNVSHEFRTPLTLMLGPVEDGLADSGQPLPPRQRERLELVHRNSLRLLRLVNALLDFSRIQAGRIHASYAPTDIGALTADLASNFRSAIERAGMELVVDCPPLTQPAYVDREMWEKIVLNLLSNAFKHTFAGSIAVSVREIGGQVELRVADTGIGISADEVPRLFERFHRVQGAKSRTNEGSGIGLALVQDLVQLHGGTVRIDSEIDRGSTFIVAIPSGSDHLPADQIGAGSAPGPSLATRNVYANEALSWSPDLAVGHDDQPQPDPAATEGSGQRIILAEDNGDMRDYVFRLLDSRWRIEAVADGAAALACARSDPPDLIVSDVMMPNVDGFELIRQLRADPALRHVPVILLSARAGSEANVAGIEAGADDYLIKPFTASELLARVAAQLRTKRIREEATRELRDSHESLKQANADLEQFASVASHDLQEPLRMSRSYLTLVRRVRKGRGVRRSGLTVAEFTRQKGASRGR